MISPKKLIQMAKKWQNMAILRRKTISLPRTMSSSRGGADKGHFVVYTSDHTRFAIPLEYLNNDVFRELLDMAEEEYGLPRDGPITLPCDAGFMEYVVSLIQRYAGNDLQKALVTSISSGGRCSLSSYSGVEQVNQRSIVCGF